jgi:hypothetical protein
MALTPPFFIVKAPSSVGTFWDVTCPAPVPLTAIAQEYIHSQCLFDSEGNSSS